MRYKKQKEIKEKRNTKKNSENTDKKIFEECKKE